MSIFNTENSGEQRPTYQAVIIVPQAELTKRTWDQITYEVLAGAPFLGRFITSHEPQVMGALAAAEVFVANHDPFANRGAKQVEKRVKESIRKGIL